VLLVHGSVLDRDAYLFEEDAAAEDLNALWKRYPRVRIGFFGHTHYPVAFRARKDGAVETEAGEEVRLRRGWRYLINPGSVGQPRDGDPRLAFVLADLGTGVVERHRVAYPAGQTARKVRDAGLPEYLAARLAEGH
jgi:diadenosine tetraphosphatase ApaH/serine/threonine PP2A family protein phosphatase